MRSNWYFLVISESKRNKKSPFLTNSVHFVDEQSTVKEKERKFQGNWFIDGGK